MREVYLDYNGSAPLDPRVAAIMVPALTDGLGNASSVHMFGRRQALAADQAREQVARLVGGEPSNVIFTSGATEANNLALRGAVEFGSTVRRRILVSAVEHASVRMTAQSIHDRGLAKVNIIPVNRGGFVDPAIVEQMLGPDVLLVSVMAANSETGILNPISEIAELTRRSGSVLHCDATQAVGREPFNMGQVGVDLVSISGHKLCGPGGIGALVGTRPGLRKLSPIMSGGGQEYGLRPGSLNVAGIVGLGAAADFAAAERVAESLRLSILRDRLVTELRTHLSGVHENGDITKRISNTTNIRFEGADADAIMSNIDQVAVSVGSACHAGSVEPSPVLLAMGVEWNAANESIRFSLGRFTTSDDITFAIERVVAAVQYVRALTGEHV